MPDDIGLQHNLQKLQEQQRMQQMIRMKMIDHAFDIFSRHVIDVEKKAVRPFASECLQYTQEFYIAAGLIKEKE